MSIFQSFTLQVVAVCCVCRLWREHSPPLHCFFVFVVHFQMGPLLLAPLPPLLPAPLLPCSLFLLSVPLPLSHPATYPPWLFVCFALLLFAVLCFLLPLPLDTFGKQSLVSDIKIETKKTETSDNGVITKNLNEKKDPGYVRVCDSSSLHMSYLERVAAHEGTSGRHDILISTGYGDVINRLMSLDRKAFLCLRSVDGNIENSLTVVGMTNVETELLECCCHDFVDGSSWLCLYRRWAGKA